MREIDPRADAPPLNWSDVGVTELLPAGMVTLLLADAEDSTRLWETQPEQMAAAAARLQRALSEAIFEHDGVQLGDQGEGDSFAVRTPGFQSVGEFWHCVERANTMPRNQRDFLEVELRKGCR